MSLLEWVRVAEDAREQQDDERVATGLVPAGAALLRSPRWGFF